MRWCMFLLTMSLAGGQTWTFDKDEAGKAPAGFEFALTGRGKKGAWTVRDDGGQKVLAQTDEDETDYRFPVAVVKESSYKNVSLSVKIKPISGGEDQAGGLVFRYKDKDNYYVVRSNVLEKNVRLYCVTQGNRKKFAGKEGVKLAAGEWHTLKIEAKGDAFKVLLDGDELFSATDKTIAEGGKIGVWTKADSVTYFDDLTAEELK